MRRLLKCWSSQALTFATCSGPARSTLFRMSMSENPTWRSLSSISGGYSGCAKTCSASTTQEKLSSRMRSRRLGSLKVTKIPAGSATPLASSRMYSMDSGRASNATTDSTRSSRIWQHTQPLDRLIMLSFTPTTSSASMLIEPKSLTRTPTRNPWSPVRMRFSSVVLPAPRKPVRMVIGTALPWSAMISMPLFLHELAQVNSHHLRQGDEIHFLGIRQLGDRLAVNVGRIILVRINFKVARELFLLVFAWNLWLRDNPLARRNWQRVAEKKGGTRHGRA